MIPFLALIRMELRLFLADPRAVLMSVVAPISSHRSSDISLERRG